MFKIGLNLIVILLFVFQAEAQKINGINFVSPKESPYPAYMTDTKELSPNWIAFTPYAFMTPGNPDIAYDVADNWWGDRPDNLRKMVKDAKKVGYKIMLKPHFWVSGQGWPGEYSLETESDWKIWESNYEQFLLNLAWLCEQNEIDMLCIGVEFKKAVQLRSSFWVGLIGKIRDIYDGELTYAANWDNYENVPFWDHLDFIGIDAYFPLVHEATPNIPNLEKQWNKIKGPLSVFSENCNKKIIFTEYGYRSCDFACWQQWEIESLGDEEHLNLEAQSNGYLAFYNSIWKEPWLAGGFLWKWVPEAEACGVSNSNYCPRGKPSAKLIRKYYELKN